MEPLGATDLAKSRPLCAIWYLRLLDKQILRKQKVSNQKICHHGTHSIIMFVGKHNFAQSDANPNESYMRGDFVRFVALV